MKTSRNSQLTEKSSLKLVSPNQVQFVFTLFRLIWNQTELRLVPIQSENGKYKLNLDYINKIQGKFLRVSTLHFSPHGRHGRLNINIISSIIKV